MGGGRHDQVSTRQKNVAVRARHIGHVIVLTDEKNPITGDSVEVISRQFHILGFGTQ